MQSAMIQFSCSLLARLLWMGGLVLILACCGKNEGARKVQATEQEVWEGEMVANPTEYEMTPNAMPRPPSLVQLENPKPESASQPVPMPTIKPPVSKSEPFESTPAVESAESLQARMLLGLDAVDPKLLIKDLDVIIENGEWKAYRDQLKSSIDLSVSQLQGRLSGDKLVALNEQPLFYSTLLRWQLLKQFPPGLWVNASDAPSFPAFARHIFGETNVMEEILITVKDQDDVLKVLPMMINLWDSHTQEPELAAKYFNLNLACAVVFDEPITLVNQDPESPEDYAESGGVDARTRYEWFVKQNERGYLEVSIDRSDARDLCFVVCAPVTERELDWAVKEYRSLRRKSWGRTYGDVKYLMERAVEGLDPYDSYTLEEIKKEGGICGDQTHFSVNTARAAGIPAIGLSGVTDAGAHAWAAIKIEDDEWSSEIGRIKGVSQGRGMDPQTGATINEQDIWMWSSREYRRASRQLEVRRQLWLARLFGELSRPETQRMVVDEARRDGQPYPEYWEVLYETLRDDPDISAKPDDPDTLAIWKDFCDDLKREFKENPRMSGLAIRVEQLHLFVYMELNDIRRQLDRDRRRQHREAAEQVDLVTDSLKRESEWILLKSLEKSEKDEDGQTEARKEALRDIAQLYDKSLREYGRSISGFQTMADDYFGFVKDEEEFGRKAVRDIELAFKRVVDTDSDNWFRAKTEVGLHQRICEMYRQVGEDKKADVMARRLETQMERARRKAL